MFPPINSLPLSVRFLQYAIARGLPSFYARKRRYNAGPYHLKLVLAAIQTMSEPDTPDDVKIRTNTSHEMPPTMSFGDYSPGQPNLMSPLPQLRAVDVVQRPNGEAT